MLHEEPCEKRASDRAESEALPITGGRSSFHEHEDVEHKGQRGSEKDAGGERLHPVLFEAHRRQAVRDTLRKRRTRPERAPCGRDEERNAGSQQDGAQLLRRTPVGASPRTVRSEDRLGPGIENLEEQGKSEEDHTEDYREAAPVDQSRQERFRLAGGIEDALAVNVVSVEREARELVVRDHQLLEAALVLLLVGGRQGLHELGIGC